MRYWLTSLAIVALVVASGDTQETKKTDKGAGKESKTDPKTPPETTEFLGKSFEQWRDDLKSTDPTKRETAMKAVLMFSLAKAEEVVPIIIADLARHPKITTVDLSVRVNGTMALNTYFLHSAKAKKTHDTKLLKDALGVYRVGLKDSQVVIKLRTVQGLLYLGPIARDALDDVITLTRDPATWELRKEAIPVMVMMATDAKGVVEPKAMIALRKSANFEVESSHLVRIVAVQGLGILGKDKAVLDLRKALEKDPSKEVRMAAAQSFVNAKESALPDLRKSLKNDPSKDVRLVVVQALGAAGGPKALKDLLGVLDELGPQSKELRLTALNTIASLKENFEPAEKKTALKRLNEHYSFEKDSIVNIWTHMTIMNLNGKCDKFHMEPITRRVNDKDIPVRLQALQAIATCGPDAKPFALQTVTEALDDSNVNIAVTAVDTLAFLYAHEAIPRLEGIMKDKKAAEQLKEAAENAIDNINLQKAQKEKKDKKLPEKK